MKKARFVLSLMLLFLISAVLVGCPTRARKPSTPAPTPKPAGKVSLSTIDPSKAPAMVKELIEKQKENESFNVVRVGNSFYAVVTRGKVPYQNFGVKFKDVEKVEINDGKSQVRVRVLLTVPDIFPGKNTEARRSLTQEERAAIKVKLGTRGQFFPVAVAKITINTLPDAFTYSVLRDKEIPPEVMGNVQGQTTTPPAAQAPQTSVTPGQQMATNITVTTPPANATVTTPLTVSGKAGTTTVDMELKDDKGNVLVSKTVSVSTAAAGQMGDFNTTLSFSPQTQPVKGTLEVFHRGTSGARENLVTIPLTIR